MERFTQLMAHMSCLAIIIVCAGLDYMGALPIFSAITNASDAMENFTYLMGAWTVIGIIYQAFVSFFYFLLKQVQKSN
ncbi:MAG: hypothetical protein BEN18_09165 [Epulopiscium sp. Nuni2H_MBin001]|nr:MAG: hypothetical protein BEN18_09165 [Epulopiscium sp. Nuni2H_MBin001]